MNTTEPVKDLQTREKYDHANWTVELEQALIVTLSQLSDSPLDFATASQILKLGSPRSAEEQYKKIVKRSKRAGYPIPRKARPTTRLRRTRRKVVNERCGMEEGATCPGYRRTRDGNFLPLGVQLEIQRPGDDQEEAGTSGNELQSQETSGAAEQAKTLSAADAGGEAFRCPQTSQAADTHITPASTPASASPSALSLAPSTTSSDTWGLHSEPGSSTARTPSHLETLNQLLGTHTPSTPTRTFEGRATSPGPDTGSRPTTNDSPTQSINPALLCYSAPGAGPEMLVTWRPTIATCLLSPFEEDCKPAILGAEPSVYEGDIPYSEIFREWRMGHSV